MKQDTPRNIRIIDPDGLAENMRLIRAAVPSSAKVMAVVKADGYGHGALTAARAALSGGADMLAVASVEEGVLIREEASAPRSWCWGQPRNRMRRKASGTT